MLPALTKLGQPWDYEGEQLFEELTSRRRAIAKKLPMMSSPGRTASPGRRAAASPERSPRKQPLATGLEGRQKRQDSSRPRGSGRPIEKDAEAAWDESAVGPEPEQTTPPRSDALRRQDASRSRGSSRSIEKELEAAASSGDDGDWRRQVSGVVKQQTTKRAAAAGGGARIDGGRSGNREYGVVGRGSPPRQQWPQPQRQQPQQAEPRRPPRDGVDAAESHGSTARSHSPIATSQHGKDATAGAGRRRPAAGLGGRNGCDHNDKAQTPERPPRWQGSDTSDSD